MHRSRLGVVLVDHPVPVAEAGRAFWSGVQGLQRPVDARPDDPYTPLNLLGGPTGAVRLEHQRIGDGPARIHLDVETDDVPAEVERLVGLGAQVLEEREGYTVLTDPAGLRLCVVPAWTAGFAAAAHTWDPEAGGDAGVSAYPARTYDKLRYADTDRQGHVNNAVFATLLETGRVELLRDPDRPLGDPGTEWVIARLELDFVAEARWPGVVDIGTGVARIGRSSVTLRQGLFQDGRTVARAETVIVQLDGRTRRGAPLGEVARARFEELRLDLD